jgi:C4-dicarboxylate transporter
MRFFHGGYKMWLKNKKAAKYIVVLAAAVAARIILAFILPFETQKYAAIIIIVLAITVFFTWDYMDKRRDDFK